VLARVLLAVVLAGILMLSLWPKPPVIPDLNISDKIEHFIAYIVLGICALAAAERRSFPTFLIAVVSCSAFGGVIELVQPFVGRSRELGDFAVDLAGSALGAGIIAAVARVKHARGRAQR
jgi:VanZ family protein